MANKSELPSDMAPEQMPGIELGNLGRSSALAEAIQAEGIDFEYIPLQSPAYESLYVLKHHQGEAGTLREPTVRLYRGVSNIDDSVLHQVAYAAKGRREDGTAGKSDDPVLLAMVERFSAEPSYDNLRSYALRLAEGSNQYVTNMITARLRTLENGILSGHSLASELVCAHIASSVIIGDTDISPFISTSPDPENAQRFGGGAVLILDVPASQVHGKGETGEVLVVGELPPTAVSAIAIKRSEYTNTGIAEITALFPSPPESNLEYVPTPEFEPPSRADLEAVSAARSAQLLEATPAEIRSSIATPEPGPHAYRQLQQRLYDYYKAAVPDLEGLHYKNQRADQDYQYDLRIHVLDRKTEPYNRDKVTDGMLHELLEGYEYERWLQTPRKQRLGRSILRS